jgi:hypothetical protein
MTATNKPFEGMTNDADSATLAGVAEAVELTHVLEDGLPKRVTRRIVISPPTLAEFSGVLSGDFSNIEDGREVAYQRISAACSKYVAAPAFYSADSQATLLPLNVAMVRRRCPIVLAPILSVGNWPAMARTSGVNRARMWK